MSTITTSSHTATDTVEKLSKLHLRADNEPATDQGQTTKAVPGSDYPYARFLPTYDHNVKYPALEPFDHVDPGHAALSDPEPRSFLDGAKENHLTPKFGSEIEGIQLSKLDSRAKR